MTLQHRTSLGEIPYFPSCRRIQTIFVFVFYLFLNTQGYAWTGEIQGTLTIDQNEVVLAGSGQWSNQQKLSFLGSAYLPTGRRLVIKMDLTEAQPDVELSLNDHQYTINYLEFSPRGATEINTEVSSGWVRLKEPYLGLLEMKLSLNVRDKGQIRNIETQLLRLIDPDYPLPEEVIGDPSFDAVIIDDEPPYQDEGCYDYLSDDSGCDPGSSYESSGDEYFDYSYSDDYGGDEATNSEEGCVDDDFAAEASSPHRYNLKRRRQPPAGWQLFLRLLPLLGSTLIIFAWRRRLLGT